MKTTIEWLQDFESANVGEKEMEPGLTFAAVFRKGDRTEVELPDDGSDDPVKVTPVGLPESFTVPRAAFRVVQ